MDELGARLQLHRGLTARVGVERIAVLDAVSREGSISAAARALGLSYRGAQDAVLALSAVLGRKVVEAQPGGAKGGTAAVTPAGKALMLAFRRIDEELAHVVGQLDAHLSTEAESLDRLTWRLGMKTSARNSLPGVVEAVTEGAVNSEVVIRLQAGPALIAIVTSESVAELALTPGRAAMALIKASFVILAPGHNNLRTSARNRLAGAVVEHRSGAVSDEIVLEVEGGLRIAATVTRESGQSLEFALGSPAQALIKASHVIVAVD